MLGNFLIATSSFASPRKQSARVQDWDSNAAIDCLTGRNVNANACTSSKNACNRNTDNTAVERVSAGRDPQKKRNPKAAYKKTNRSRRTYYKKNPVQS